MKHPKTAVEMGAAIATRRVEVGLTQEQLAAQLGMDVISISRFERGNRFPTLDILLELAEILGVTPSSLIEAQSEDVEAQARQIAKAILSLGPEDRVWLKHHIRDLCKKLASVQAKP